MQHLFLLFCYAWLSLSFACFAGGEGKNGVKPEIQEQRNGIGIKFENELNKYLAANLQAFSSWSIAEIRTGQSTTETNAAQLYTIDPARAMVLNIPFAYIPITINSPRGKLKTVLTVRLNLKRMALVAIKDIPVNVDLQVSDFTTKEVDAIGMRGEVIRLPEEVLRYRAKMYIRAGICLTDQMVRPKAIIKHNDPVACYIRTGSVMISLDCTAREDGCLGDIIRVMSKEKKLYRAKIESSETARIVE